MIRVIPAAQRHSADFGWLQTNWLFSFDQYYDPNNLQFGNLRVFNDDVVQPQTGFGTHPHREMEIVTIVLSGAVTHQDSMGNHTKISAGEVQRMTAGAGITHSEYNRESVPLHLYQIWFPPHTRRLVPSYEQQPFEASKLKNALHRVVSGNEDEGLIKIHAHASIYLSQLDPGVTVEHNLATQRGAFVYVTEGVLDVNGIHLTKTDQARIEEEPLVRITAAEASRFILIDVDLAE
ncbi:MAG: pirin family protein [bacterium]|nr:pirin family protein [bacterium]